MSFPYRPKKITLHYLHFKVDPVEAARVLPILDRISGELNVNLPSHATVNVHGYFNMDLVNAIGISAAARPEKLTFWQKYFKRMIPEMKVHLTVCVAQMEYL
jgi:hypothetical protein